MKKVSVKGNCDCSVKEISRTDNTVAFQVECEAPNGFILALSNDRVIAERKHAFNGEIVATLMDEELVEKLALKVTARTAVETAEDVVVPAPDWKPVEVVVNRKPVEIEMADKPAARAKRPSVVTLGSGGLIVR